MAEQDFLDHCHILVMPAYEVGSQAPEGYLQWHEWAETQHKAGLRQVQCGKCLLWRYPQELSGEELRYEATTKRGVKRMICEPICNKCHLDMLAKSEGSANA
jgi:hypothetical protein